MTSIKARFVLFMAIAAVATALHERFTTALPGAAVGAAGVAGGASGSAAPLAPEGALVPPAFDALTL